MLTYEQIIAGFNRRMLGGVKDRIKFLKPILASLGNPDRQFKIIHIAGTNGKGSTGMMLEQSLQYAGYKVGYFNSPALVDDREQVKINDKLISRQAFVDTYQKIVRRLPVNITPADITVFEWWTLIMIQYFADQKVDWAVIECGLGGRDDATNIINAPLIAVITHIALDHTRILGPEITDVAYAKAGIIKTGTHQVFLGPCQQEAVSDIIHDYAQSQNVELTLAKEQKIIDGKAAIFFNNALHSVPFSLLGEFQSQNLGTVISVFRYLIQEGFINSWQPLLTMMKTISIPGRMQVIAHHPTVVLDGAHNPDAAHQLYHTLQFYPSNKIIMVLGFLADKNIIEMCKTYQRLTDRLIITIPNHLSRAFPVTELAAILPQAVVAKTPNEGLAKARELANPDDLIIVTGSFYTIKDIEANLNEK
ncbi:bifunctional folylpolyglutamate synthase/dihydrofolate synthase [Limosilactobacillus albertensis]|uniref:tetrahydrofolate synthase n=1 Tax=Limosilactobacillus albertensis TaxID=2759752 RepID=A0A839H2Q7_9LACO|nr:cyanophycin synthetase [Limosilactobacillus albertensis]MBB1122620.1 bifunctional folylpolyglutamate synthase/dihydrofolate synthase [Limosilactobacillus albertensis]MCD7122908.1 bifunctional folylpolyglutamate synthase/dihydrofolate synthase [Limosilactobacillus albertensis]